MPGYAELQDILGYCFSNPRLMDEATLAQDAPSTAPPKTHGNKSLALVGDALIRLDVAGRSYAGGIGTAESTILLSEIGSNRSLEAHGRRLGLDKFVIKHPGQQGQDVPRETLASTVEALIGAVWIDSGQDFNQVQSVIGNLGIGNPKHEEEANT
ncbi:ribonuclease III domain-containing protein [Chaetomium fimeti]|uniref:Ribonuclease III domain-containing protein n=1 Tax=Chaetomium fimeti TaxID=1854472 RepID=A0AAE0LNA4_9PEZI|nr:ribonuclease III domain-containing protein [Chaetomium fimeti]